MTITVTIEELRDYETRCDKWGRERAAAAEKRLVTIRQSQADALSDRFSLTRVELPKDSLAQWDAANPFPKIIPSV